MADTIRTRTALLTLLADNTTGDISPQDIRDWLVSTFEDSPVVTKSTAGPYVPTLDDGLIIVTYAGDYVINLPSAATALWTGKILRIKKGFNTNYKLSIAADGAELIDDKSIFYIYSQYVEVTIISDGTNWHVIDSYSTAPTAKMVISNSTTLTVADAAVEYPITIDTNVELDGFVHTIAGDGDTVVTITEADPAVISWTAHNLGAGSPVQFTTTDTLPNGITAGTIYYVIAAGLVADSFQISTAPGGAAVDTSVGGGVGTQTAYNSARIGFLLGGDYLFTISCIVSTTSNTDSLMDIWGKLNGVNIAKGSSQVGVTTTSLNITLSRSYVLDVTAGDYLEMYYHGSVTNIRLLAIAAQTGPPVIPAAHSVVMTADKIGR